MTVNRTLAAQQGLSEDEIVAIEAIHTKLEKLLTRANLGVFNTSIYNAIEQLEFQAQELWGFKQDASRHTWKKKYEFRCQWANRTFKCDKTGETFTIPSEVEERDCFFWGEAMIDVGRFNCYSRYSNCTEVVAHGEI